MENNSKQAVLSIIGIAVLVIAVVGVSFAFFTYSKTGTTDNVITTGSISFNFTETSAGLMLEDQFPQTAAEGKTNDTFDFSVTSTLPSTMQPIVYTVKAVPGDEVTGKTRLQNSQINFYATTSGGTISNGYGAETGAVVGEAIDGDGLQIATGTIPAGSNGLTHTYSITMWVNESVTISDTDTTKTYCASASQCAGGRTVYSNLYYSFKIKVDAQG